MRAFSGKSDAGASDAGGASKKKLSRIDQYIKKHDPLYGKAKNRLGQRARRELYEKKYGRNANHLKKQQPTQPAAGKQEQVREWRDKRVFSHVFILG